MFVLVLCFLFFGELYKQTEVSRLTPCLIWVLVFMQLKTAHCAQLELPSTDSVTWDQTPPVTSAQVQPRADFICLCLLIDSQSVMLISQYIMSASTFGKYCSLTCNQRAL